MTLSCLIPPLCAGLLHHTSPPGKFVQPVVLNKKNPCADSQFVRNFSSLLDEGAGFDALHNFTPLRATRLIPVSGLESSMLESSKVPALTRAIDILNLIARIGLPVVLRRSLTHWESLKARLFAA